MRRQSRLRILIRFDAMRVDHGAAVQMAADPAIVFSRERSGPLR